MALARGSGRVRNASAPEEVAEAVAVVERKLEDVWHALEASAPLCCARPSLDEHHIALLTCQSCPSVCLSNA